MAILVESEKKSSNWVVTISILVVFVVILAGVYYVFFQTPTLIEVVTPRPLQGLSGLAQVSGFKPEEVVNSAAFKSLRSYAEDIVAPTLGRDNPFKPL